MRVKTTHTALTAFYDESLMGDEYEPPGIRFNAPKEDGTRTSQRIKKEVGERLVAELDRIEPLDEKKQKDDDAETDTETES